MYACSLFSTLISYVVYLFIIFPRFKPIVIGDPIVYYCLRLPNSLKTTADAAITTTATTGYINALNIIAHKNALSNYFLVDCWFSVKIDFDFTR